MPAKATGIVASGQTLLKRQKGGTKIMLTLNDVKLIAETMAGCPGSRMVIHSEDEVRVVGPEEVNLAVIMSDGKPMRSRRILLRVQTTGW